MQESYLVEEVFNSISHGFGTLLATTGLVLYFLNNSPMKDLWKLVGVSIFGGVLFSYILSPLSLIVSSTQKQNEFF